MKSNGYWLYQQVVKDDYCVLSGLNSCRISIIKPHLFFLLFTASTVALARPIISTPGEHQYTYEAECKYILVLLYVP